MRSQLNGLGPLPAGRAKLSVQLFRSGCNSTLDRPVQQSARELIILELYREGRIAAGKAAELFGMGRSESLRVAAQLGVPYFEMTNQEWNEEISESRKI